MLSVYIFLKFLLMIRQYKLQIIYSLLHIFNLLIWFTFHLLCSCIHLFNMSIYCFIVLIQNSILCAYLIHDPLLVKSLFLQFIALHIYSLLLHSFSYDRIFNLLLLMLKFNNISLSIINNVLKMVHIDISLRSAIKYFVDSSKWRVLSTFLCWAKRRCVSFPS